MKIVPLNNNYNNYRTSRMPFNTPEISFGGKQSHNFQTANSGEASFWKKKLLCEVESIEKIANKNNKKYLDALFDLRFEGMEFKKEAVAKLDYILGLYSSGMGYNKDGGEVIIDGNYITEYTKDDEILRRTEIVDGGEKIVKKRRPLIGGYYDAKVKVGPQVKRMIEFNPDGSCNLYIDGYYTEGYMEYEDGSASYKRQILIDKERKFKENEIRIYSKDYTLDSNGNESWYVSTFKDKNSSGSSGFDSVKCFKINERLYTDKAETCDLIYEFGGKRFGNACEGYILNYSKTPSGRETADQEIVSMIPNGLKSYKEKTVRTADGFESFRKCYARKNEFDYWQYSQSQCNVSA